MHATIFGNVTAIVQRMYGARKSVYQSKWRDLKDFAILHSVPKHLKQRMQDYFHTMWSLNHGIDPVEVSQLSVIRSSRVLAKITYSVSQIFLVRCSFQYCVILEEITPAKADSKFTRRLEPPTLRVNNLKPPKTKAISLLAVVKPIADSGKQLILESSYVGATQMSLDLSDAPDVIPLDDDDAAYYASRAIPLTHHAFHAGVIIT